MRRIGILLVLLVALAACTDEEDFAAEPSPSPSRTVPIGPSPPVQEPEIEIPDGNPPKELVVEDLKEGDGTAVTGADTLQVHYRGVAWSTKKEFDSSYDRGQPATFPLAQVIRGWQEGLVGMKIGGRRKLTIPPEMGYGAQGSPPDIGPNETLVFIVDLIAINP